MTSAASKAARELSRARWGDRRVRTLVDELISRIGEVDSEQADRLRDRLDESRRTRATASER